MVFQVFATPETQIGFHPDAGASFHLSRLPGHLGRPLQYVFFMPVTLAFLYWLLGPVMYMFNHGFTVFHDKTRTIFLPLKQICFQESTWV